MTVVTAEILASSDDAQENGTTGVMDLTNAGNRPGTNGSNLYAGMRYLLDVDPLSTVSESYLDVTFPNSGQDNLGWRIQAELIADAPTFTSTVNNISDRTLTTASVDWVDSNVAPFSGAVVRSPDISSVIQEVVDFAGFAKNNHVAIIITGISGDANTATYDRSPVGTLGVSLEVTFTAPAGGSDVLPQTIQGIGNGIVSSGGGSNSGLHSITEGFTA